MSSRTQTKNAKKPKVIKTWNDAKKVVVRRVDLFGQQCELERGVNFFVLMLEKLGAVTEWSCEGHPSGFYIVFNAPLAVAQKIHSCGFFTVELEGGITERNPRWSIRASRVDTERERRMVLRWAADSWFKTFGSITLNANNQVVNRKKK